MVFGADPKQKQEFLHSLHFLIWNDRLSSVDRRGAGAHPTGKRPLADSRALHQRAGAGSRGAAGAARRARSPGGRAGTLISRCAGGRSRRQDDGRHWALRRRVTLIFGGYSGVPEQSTQDSASSRGRAVYKRELGRTSVSHGSDADPLIRADVHPSPSRRDHAPHFTHSLTHSLTHGAGSRRRL